MGAAADLPRLLILYGSETGNAQDVAERVAREAARRHYRPALFPMDRYAAEALPTEAALVCVASTTGQGEPPANMRHFWRVLLRKSLPPGSLAGTQAAVFGLGDSAYPQFNVAARKLAARLGALGAPDVQLALGDDSHPGGHEAALDPFLDSLWARLRLCFPLSPGCTDPAPRGPAEAGRLPPLEPPKLLVSLHPPLEDSTTVDVSYDRALLSGPPALLAARAAAALDAALAAADGGQGDGAAADAARPDPDGDAAAAPGEEGCGYGPGRPYLASLVRSVRLTSADHPQPVHHLELGVGPLRYRVGDALAVVPANPPGTMEALAARLGLPLEASVLLAINCADTTMPRPEEHGGGRPWWSGPWPLRSLLEGAVDAAGACPRRYWFQVLAHGCTEPREAERLAYFALTAEGRNDLWEYAGRERRTLLEVLQDFPSAQPPLAWLLQAGPRLRPRYFSVASAPEACPGGAQLTVAHVQWRTTWGRERHGLCSSWLARLPPTTAGDVADAPGSESPAARIPVWVTSGTLPPPPLEQPLVLIGPGTGVAPLRAFLQARQLAIQRGAASVGPALLFFGCRNAAGDYLYREELEGMAAPGGGGPLDPQRGGGLITAFSRDQVAKQYVTHVLREPPAAGKVWSLLSAGGAVYVCGAAGKMPSDVAAALEALAVQEGGLTAPEAAAWLKGLAAARRYHVETWA